MNKIETVHKLCQEVIEDILKLQGPDIRYNEYYIGVSDHPSYGYIKDCLRKYKVLNERNYFSNIRTKPKLTNILFGGCNFNESSLSFDSLKGYINFFYENAVKCEKHLNEKSKEEQFNIIFENMNELLRCLNEIKDKISITEEDFIRDFEEDFEIYKKITNKYNFRMCNFK